MLHPYCYILQLMEYLKIEEAKDKYKIVKLKIMMEKQRMIDELIKARNEEKR